MAPIHHLNLYIFTFSHFIYIRKLELKNINKPTTHSIDNN